MNHHAISEFCCFGDPRFLALCEFFPNCLYQSPRLLLETKHFASTEDSLGFSTLCDIFRKKISVSFKKVFSWGQSGFRVLSSMKGALWCLEPAFRTFQKYFLKTWRFLSLKYCDNFGRSRLVYFSDTLRQFSIFVKFPKF